MCCFDLNPDNFNPKILFFFQKKFDSSDNPPCHSHDCISLIYIISGSCTYNIDEKLSSVSRGSLLIMKPGVKHKKIFASGEEVVEFQIGFENISLKVLLNENILEDDAQLIFNFSKYNEEFLNCCREIKLEQDKDESGSGLVLKALVMKFIALFIKASHSEKDCLNGGKFNVEPYDKANMAKAVASYIDINYTKKISLDRIAKNMYLSPAYLSKVFKEQTGESPINYLIKVRLSKAKQMLEERGISVKTAASAVGYNDIYHFSKLFKKHYGNPPSIYSGRKQ